MADRNSRIAAFAENSGWGDAQRRPLAGDASNRRYLRLVRATGATAVLMDAPPERGEDVRPFLHIAHHLASLGLSAPKILAKDVASGLLLLEDLGDDVFARIAAMSPAREAPLYLAAAEALIALQDAPPPAGLICFTPPHMADLIRVVFDWYAPEVPTDESAGFLDRLEAVLFETVADPPVLALRDFHAENLVWLPGRIGPARVGLLDFQDAVIAHPAYDLVSLLHDARRDVSEATSKATLRHFLDLSGQDAVRFGAAVAALSLQRNLRILGVFARLSRQDGKTGYLRYIPRVWGHVREALGHPALGSLRDPLIRLLPPPDTTTLARLETPCATPVP